MEPCHVRKESSRPLAGLALIATALPASADTVVQQTVSGFDAFGNRTAGVRVDRTDPFGNLLSKSRLVHTDAFGDRVVGTRTPLDPAGLGKISKVKVTKADAFGDVIGRKKVVLTSF